MTVEYGPCSGCGEVQTPLGYVCVDCAYPDKQRREDYVTRLRDALDAAQLTLMDRFVMAALPVAQRMNIGTLFPALIVSTARELAAEMIRRRKS